MGGGIYSNASAEITRSTNNYHTSSNEQIFKSRSLDSEMNPHGVALREARDSDEHPNSVGIIIGLDVTGSMGSVPQNLVRDGLPTIMGRIIESGEEDPQVLFVAIGDHKSDRAPLQVGQFESNDVALDKWLTTTYLEGNGGGNGGESYLLAWYFAAHSTSMDCFEKRGRKGILFTIGDEPNHQLLPGDYIRDITGNGEGKSYTADELLVLASETYEVYHIHVQDTYNGRRAGVLEGWKETLGDHVLVAETANDIPALISSTVISLKGDNTPTVVSSPVDTTSDGDGIEIIL